jgi:hypothetical protein
MARLESCGCIAKIFQHRGIITLGVFVDDVPQIVDEGAKRFSIVFG